MSKYTEAIEVLERNKPTSDPRECGRELCSAVDVAIKALEMADRLEQADAELHDTILYDLDRTVGIPNSEVFMQGYNQAITDIRGDAE